MEDNLDGSLRIEETLDANVCLSFYASNLNEFRTTESKVTNDMQNSKRLLEKTNILKEILSSEKKYLGDLREIVEVCIFSCSIQIQYSSIIMGNIFFQGYYEEICKIHGKNEEFLYKIFSNIKEIYEFTK